ncbi:hypothetical protein AMJ47_01725 [Parcubacteria bacterium DG_72]|nr:MAG: hypothetical protein AMJ47_01725 [Parcubacteria bacterium DG_72]
MAVDFIEKKKKQQYLLYIVLGILAVTFVILWFGYFQKPVQAPAPEEVVISRENIVIDYSILENPILKVLLPFEETPLYEGELGKENPFLK